MSSSGTDQRPAARKVGWLELSVLLSSGVPAAVAIGCLLPVLPKIEEALAHNPQDTYLVKFISTAAGLAMVLGAPISGYLSDRYGRKPLLIGSSILFAAFGIWGYFLNDLYELIGVRFVVGAAAAATITSGATLIGDLFEGNMRSRLMGLNVAISTVVGGLALPAAGYLGDISWRMAFLIHGISIPLVILALGLKPVPTAQPAAIPIEVHAPSGERVPFPYGFVFFALLCGMVVLSLMVFMPFRLREMGITSTKLISIALMSSVVTNVLSSALFGAVRKRLSAEQSYMATFSLCGVGAFAIALSPTYSGVIVGALIFGLGMGGMAPNLMTVAAGAVGHARRGRSVGAVKGTFLSGSFLAVVAFEPFSKIWGPWASLCAIGSASTVMLLFCLIRYVKIGKPQLQSATS